MNRYFSPSEFGLGDTVALPAGIAKHAVKVLRGAVGDQLELVTPSGGAFLTRITSLEPFTVLAEAALPGNPELPLEVTIVCGVGKGDKAEWITQKATELGAAGILFYNAAWGTSKWPAERVPKKLARLQAVALGAAEQSHRLRVPRVDWLPDLAGLQPGGARLVAYEESAKAGETARLVATMASRPTALTVVFGPEGGISPKELAVLEAHDFLPAGLGPRILRTETAPLYLLSAVSALSELQGVRYE